MKRIPKAQRRIQIRDGAIQVLSREGYFKTTTSLLSKELGIAEMILYRSFSNKDELVCECISHVREERLEYWKTLKEGIEPVALLESIARDFIKSPAQTSPNFLMLMRLSSERVPEKIALELSRTFQTYVNYLNSILLEIHTDISSRELESRAWGLFEWAIGLGVVQLLPEIPCHEEDFLQRQFQLSMSLALAPSTDGKSR